MPLGQSAYITYLFIVNYNCILDKGERSGTQILSHPFLLHLLLYTHFYFFSLIFSHHIIYHIITTISMSLFPISLLHVRFIHAHETIIFGTREWIIFFCCCHKWIKKIYKLWMDEDYCLTSIETKEIKGEVKDVIKRREKEWV